MIDGFETLTLLWLLSVEQIDIWIGLESIVLLLFIDGSSLITKIEHLTTWHP